MERLTFKHNGRNVVDLFDVQRVDWCDANQENWESANSGTAIDKLAEYEDTGMTPDEIHKLNSFEKSQMAILLKRNAKLRQKRDYWKTEALKWANELGEGRIGPLLYMDERSKK